MTAKYKKIEMLLNGGKSKTQSKEAFSFVISKVLGLKCFHKIFFVILKVPDFAFSAC